MKKITPFWAGLAQSLGLTAYVLLFTTFIYGISRFVNESNNPWFMIIPLMALVLSALICGSIALLYPAILFFDGKRKQALLTIMWTGICLVVLFGVIVFFMT